MATIAEALSAALHHHQASRFQEAEALYWQVLQLQPDHPDALHLLGMIAYQVGRHDVAVEHIGRAISLKPNIAEFHNNIGGAYQALGRLAQAVEQYQRALVLKPDYPEAHSNLGNVLRDQGHLEAAEVHWRQALTLRPAYPEAHLKLGAVLSGQGRLTEAEAHYRQALSLDPGYADAYSNLGVVLEKLDQLKEAEAQYQRALALKPDLAEAHNNLGNTLRAQLRHSEAELSYRRALALKPSYAEAHNNLGNILQDQCRLTEAEASYRRALELAPNYALAHSNRLFCLSHSVEMDAKTLFVEHRRFGEQFEVPLQSGWRPHSNSRDPARCLQVGFVSADLREHAVANFIEPVMMCLSGNPNWSAHAYYNHPIEDRISQRLRGHFTHWHSIVGLSDAAFAENVRADGIDILIDLAGHTARHRLLAFARKPAPLQASWIGYPGTTGLRGMDYFLSDGFHLPPGEFDGQFTEKIVRLPAIAPFRPVFQAPPVTALPALNNGYVTFGSFNQLSKLNPSVIALWAQLLRVVPDSRIVLGAMPRDGKFESLIKQFAGEGIVRERLSFYTRCDMDTYLGLHQHVDICLDTFPYNGSTTSCHALWMGVPTLTLAGRTVPGRAGAGILGHLGLEEFISRDAAQFVEKGLYWASGSNRDSLVRLRSSLRERFRQSALGQPETVAAGVERALRTMWRRWCAGLPAESFAVGRQDLSGAMRTAHD